MPTAFSIIILTHNEERHLPRLLESVRGLGCPLFVLDSGSADRTVEIAEAHGATVLQHPFENYSKQRNWAQENLPIDTDWVLHLDAGERCTPEMVHWLKTGFDPGAEYDGYMFSRRTLFFEKWIRRGGHYPNYHLRLFRRHRGRCEDKAYDQHFVCDGPTLHLPAGIDIIDTVCDNLLEFTQSHARWALFEAIETVAKTRETGEVKPRFFGTPIERRRWLKTRLFQRSPLFLRAFGYLFYRYLLRGGFRDGVMGLVFHMLQGFWFRFLIDAYIVELRWRMRTTGKPLDEIVQRNYGPRFLKAIPPNHPTT